MPYRRNIPKQLLILYPHLSIQELRAVVNEVFKAKNNVMRQAQVFKIKLPGIGVIRSHANKRKKGYKDVKKRDRERKRLTAQKKKL